MDNKSESKHTVKIAPYDLHQLFDGLDSILLVQLKFKVTYEKPIIFIFFIVV